MLPLCDRILLVDDNTDNLMILDELLALDYATMSVTSGEEALRVAASFRPDLVLLDVMMPGINGIETCRSLRALPELKGSRIVMLSARTKLPDRIAAYDVGAVDYIGKPFDHYEVTSKIRAWMHVVQKAKVEEIWHEAELASHAVGSAMLNMASFRDTETGEHLFRVRWYAQLLADELGRAGPYRRYIDNDFRDHLYRASPLHDVGKVAIDDAILRKPGPLTKEEFESMKRHTVIGAEMLRNAARKLPNAKYLQMAVEIARHHHERFDGSGYPDGLAGTAIPLAARILAVADVFDALTSKRVYKKAVSMFEAARILFEESGQHFDPVIVDAFKSCLGEFHESYTRFSAQCAMYDGSLLASHAMLSESGSGESLMATTNSLKPLPLENPALV
jgi:putative two-component system response regulator